MAIATITKENFKQTVLESQKPVLIDMWASWCGPCMSLAPIIEEIAKERPDITVGKVNVEEQRELASAFRVMGIPNLIVIKGGKVVRQEAGVRPKDQILALLD